MNKNKLRKNIKYGTNSAVFTAAVIGIVILLNLMLDPLHIQWDLTRGKVYSLSDEGKKALQNVNEKVEILFFADPSDSISLDINQLYENIRSVTDQVSLEIMNPMKNPSLVNQYQIDSMYTSVVSTDKRSRQVPAYDLIRTNYETGEQYFDGEASLIQAILDVTAEDQTNVYLLEGHGEFQKDRDLVYLRTRLEQKGVKVHSYSLTQEGKLPEDVDMIYILGPQFDYTEKEIQLLETYLEEGGKMILAFNDYMDGENYRNLKNFSAQYGISVEDQILKDPTRNYSGDEETLIPEYTAHEIVEKLNTDQIATIIPRARRLSIEKKEDITTEIVLQTSEEAPIAVTAEKDLENDKKMQLFIIGNAFFAHDQVIGLGGNSEIFFGVLKWLREDSSIVDIPPKTYTPEPIIFIGSQPVLIFIVSVLLIPLFVFLFGGMIYFRRRSL